MITPLTVLFNFLNVIHRGKKINWRLQNLSDLLAASWKLVISFTLIYLLATAK